MSAKPYEQFFHVFFDGMDPGDFPLRFTAEVTNRCNLGCTTCPRQESGRGFGDMDAELFGSLARQASGRDVLFYPQGFGESFLHPRYPELLELLAHEDVRHPVVITNGTLLDAANRAALLDAKPRVVIVSLDGADPEVFERQRVNAKYDEVVANVEALLELRAARGETTPHLILSLVGTDAVKASLAEFEALWEPKLLETDEIFVCSAITWAGTFGFAGAPEPAAMAPERSGGGRPPCRMLYKTLTVYYDGRTTPCCYDHACQLEVGNANEASVEEIWKGERLADLRRLHEEGRQDEIPLCAGCPELIP